MPAPLALVDCNNFYASCERLFQPELRGKKLGRQRGQGSKLDRLAPKVLALVVQGRSYRLIEREVKLGGR